jgi:hypothetical protein
MNLVGRQIDHYRVDALLGEGGMGSVYKAYDIHLARPVALKIMHANFASQAEFQRRFMQEAQAAARLDHPSIVDIYRFGSGDGVLYMVMEFVPGASLGTYLKRLRQRAQVLKLSESLLLLAQVSDALGYAHRQGVVHRDVKPDNILLKPLDEPDREGELALRAVVTDFGLAKLLEGGIQTQSGMFMGTLPYMSPEQVMGKHLDGRSDIYALGVLLYQLATGQLPFDIKSPTDAVLKHVHEAPPPPRQLRPGVPVAVENVINRAIAKEPAERFQSGEEFARAMRQAAGGLSDADVTRFGPPEGVVSLVTQVGSERPAEPSRAGLDLTAMPGEDRLLIARKGEAPRAVPLTKALMIGRSEDASLTLAAEGISRHHARIEPTGDGGWQVADQGSTNGTFLEEGRLLPNVPERWEQGQTLRVGPYFLRWQRVKGQPTPQQAGATVGGTYRATALGGFAAAGATEFKSAGGQLVATIQPTQVEVAPGGQAPIQVTLLNQGVTVDHFKVRVEELPGDWHTIPQDTLQLMPGSQGALSLIIHPPSRAAARAGVYHYRIVVTSTQGRETASAEGQVVVRPLERFTSDIRPARVPNGGVCRVLVRNDGNAPASYTIVARDPADLLRFGNSPGRLELEPGEKGTHDLHPAARRPLTGAPASLPFEVQVTSHAGDRQVKSGQLEVRPLLPPWALPLLGLLFLCLCLSLGGLYTFNRQRNEQATATAGTQLALLAGQTATQVALETLASGGTAAAAQATGQAATATAEAASLAGDDDGDGLSNRDEATAGTDPRQADTDGDRLIDGVEVNQYGTDPRNVDSDGDTLTDGQEVNDHHTAPRNADTDGDGVPDGVEVSSGRNPLEPEAPTDEPTSPPTVTATGTPTATPTATPPPTATALAVYVDNSFLWLMPFTVSGDAVTAGSSRQLADVEGVVAADISPNGQKVAFVGELIGNNNELFVVNIDGSGLASLASSAELSLSPVLGANPAETRRLVGSFQWLADSQTVAFNTNTINLVGPGISSNEDLWLASAGGPPVEQFGSGTAGGSFAISAHNRVLFGRPTEIGRANLDGSGLETLITFPFINTASEYVFYPRPQWLADGSRAMVAIPSAEPFDASASAALWSIPADGPANFLSAVGGNILFSPVFWNNAGNRLAYAQWISGFLPQLYLGDGAGGGLQPYGDALDQVTFLEWNQAGNAFLYSSQDGAGQSSYSIGAPGTSPVTVPTGNRQVLAGRWLTDSAFVVAIGTFGSWELQLGSTAGAGASLGTIVADQPVMDVWAP